MTTFTDLEKRNIARQMEKIGVFPPAIDQLTRIEAKLDAILAALERSGIVPPADQQGAEQ